MKRSGIKRKKGIRRVSKRRAGLSKEQRAELEDMHRDAVMLRYSTECKMIEFFMPATDKRPWDRSAWEGQCLRCRKSSQLYCSHIFPKGEYPSSRYDADNAIPLCYHCHIHWWHKHPIAAKTWIEEKLGAEVLGWLTIRVSCAMRPEYVVSRLLLQKQITLGRNRSVPKGPTRR